MTYIPTWAEFVYVVVVLDAYSRKVVGWAFGQQQTADLVIQALNMARMKVRAAPVPAQDAGHYSNARANC